MRSAALTGPIDAEATAHLLRSDGQEDIAFGLWRPSTGAERITALVQELIMPGPGDRRVHGNVSFEPQYLERAMSTAAAKGAGLLMMHSHPQGRGWQGMSPDDVAAEQGNAAAVAGATGLPFLGMTLAGDRTWSARFWERTAPRTYPVAWCRNVRVIGDAFRVSFNPDHYGPRKSQPRLVRTLSAWGDRTQASLVRLRVAVVGAGSVGGLVAEGLARMGFEHVDVFDFDDIEELNLDRLCYATPSHVGDLKAPVLARRLREIATADNFEAEAIPAPIYDPRAFRRALDYDLLFSCVDRPWGRHVLNYIANVHVIPVVDGGIATRRNRAGELAGADWRAHVAAPGRACLQCLGQYDAGLVQLEREGHLDDPTYIAALPEDHVLKARQNVFTFAMSCASFQLMQMLSMVVDPLGRANIGAQLYHFVGGELEPPNHPVCHEECLFPGLVAMGDHAGMVPTAKSEVA